MRSLAKMTGRSHTYLQKMINRESVFDANDIEVIAGALGISVESIIRPALVLRRELVRSKHQIPEGMDDASWIDIYLSERDSESDIPIESRRKLAAVHKLSDVLETMPAAADEAQGGEPQPGEGTDSAS